MRPGQHNKRGRNRHRGGGGGGGGGGGSGGNPLSRVYESNGPDVKVRGNAQTIADKYLQLGRDAQSSGDTVMAESYYQHAEHYLRIVAAAQAYQQQMQAQYRRPDEQGEEDEGEESGEVATVEPRHPQPMAEGTEQPMEVSEPMEGSQPQRGGRDFRDRDREGGQQGGFNGRSDRRPRWQDRRDQQNYGEGRSRGDDHARERAENIGNGGDDQGQWDAPSFLRRPSPVMAGEGDGEQPAQGFERRPRGERRPRRDREPGTSDDGQRGEG